MEHSSTPIMFWGLQSRMHGQGLMSYHEHLIQSDANIVGEENQQAKLPAVYLCNESGGISSSFC